MYDNSDENTPSMEDMMANFAQMQERKAIYEELLELSGGEQVLHTEDGFELTEEQRLRYADLSDEEVAKKIVELFIESGLRHGGCSPLLEVLKCFHGILTTGGPRPSEAPPTSGQVEYLCQTIGMTFEQFLRSFPVLQASEPMFVMPLAHPDTNEIQATIVLAGGHKAGTVAWKHGKNGQNEHEMMNGATAAGCAQISGDPCEMDENELESEFDRQYEEVMNSSLMNVEIPDTLPEDFGQ